MKIEKRIDTAKDFLFGEVREPLFLAKTEGKTLPYLRYNVPRIFRKPLIVSGKGKIEGWKSGGRSALVNYRRKWFDIEGVKPSAKEWVPGVPEGGDTRKEAENELKAGELFYRYGLKNNVEALMKPVCLFEYSNIRFQGEPVYASVLETKGDYRLSHFLGDYLTAAGKAFGRLQNDSARKTKIERIADNLEEGLINKIGQWVGFWYHCLDENNLLWGTSLEKKDEMYSLNSNAGNNNLTAYRLNNGVAVGIVDLNGFRVTEPLSKALEIDRIKKRLSIFEMALHILRLGRSAINICQYQYAQTLASKLYIEVSPPKGVNIYQERYGYDPLQDLNLPRIGELDIIKHFNDGRNGARPELIEEKFILSIDRMFFA